MPGELTLAAFSCCQAVSPWLGLGRQGYEGGRLFSTGTVEGVPALLQPRKWATTWHARGNLAFCVQKHRQLPAKTTYSWKGLRFTGVLGWKVACLVGS